MRNEMKSRGTLALLAAVLSSVAADPYVCTSNPKPVHNFTDGPTPVNPPGYGPGVTPQTNPPTISPTTWAPTGAPSVGPTINPTSSPTTQPSLNPTPSPSISPTLHPTAPCPLFVLDFYDLTRGEYITDQLRLTYGVTVHAEPTGRRGYTPGGAARVFDSSDTGDADFGDVDLGSPNLSCGGPGHGDGGAKGATFENCLPAGKILIVQEANRPLPDDAATGGNITFTFLKPVEILSATYFDTDASEGARTTLTFNNGSPDYTHQSPNLGDNGVFTQDFTAMSFGVSVNSLMFSTDGSGGVSDIRYRYCPDNTQGKNTAAEFDSPTSSANCPEDLNLDFEVLAKNRYIMDNMVANWGVNITAYSKIPELAYLGENSFSPRVWIRDSVERKVLIVQSNDTSTTQGVDTGFSIRFQFPRGTVFIHDIHTMDSTGAPEFLIVKADGTKTAHTGTPSPKPSVSIDTIDEDYVREMWVVMPDGGAVGHIRYKWC